MTTTEIELLRLEKEQSDLSNSRSFKAKKSIENCENYTMLVCFALGPIGLITHQLLFNEKFKPTFGSILELVFFGLYPGCFAMLIVAGLVSSVIGFFIHRYYRVSEKDVNGAKLAANQIDRTIKRLQVEVRKEKRRGKENELSAQVNDLRSSIFKKEISKEEALFALNQLKKRNAALEGSDPDLHNQRPFGKEISEIEEGLVYYGLNTEKSVSDSYKPKATVGVQRESTSKISTERPDKSAPKKEIRDTLGMSKNNIASAGARRSDPVPNKVNSIAETEVKEPTPAPTGATKPTTSLNATSLPDQNTTGVTHQTEIPSVKPKLEDELPFDQVLNNSPKTVLPRVHGANKPLKRDYEALNERRAVIGTMGEEYALAWEKKRLAEQGLSAFINQVKHVARTDDSLGYDILSYSWRGLEKYIEVKTTTDDQYAPFYLTESEIRAMKRLPNYFIYRVFNLNTETGEGRIYTVDCKKNIERFYTMEPMAYRVTPK